jgi:hypothetical protein
MAPKLIEVPNTEPGAYQPERSAGTLLQAQAVHLREALIRHAHELTTLLAVDLRLLKSEADVSAYIHKGTALLHTHAARPGKK